MMGTCGDTAQCLERVCGGRRSVDRWLAVAAGHLFGCDRCPCGLLIDPVIAIDWPLSLRRQGALTPRDAGSGMHRLSHLQCLSRLGLSVPPCSVCPTHAVSVPPCSVCSAHAVSVPPHFQSHPAMSVPPCTLSHPALCPTLQCLSHPALSVPPGSVCPTCTVPPCSLSHPALCVPPSSVCPTMHSLSIHAVYVQPSKVCPSCCICLTVQCLSHHECPTVKHLFHRAVSVSPAVSVPQ